MLRSYQPGEIILAQNELSVSFFIIIRGRIKFEMKGRSFFLSDGDFFGEEGMFFNKPSPFTLIASEETQLQVLDKKEAREFILKNYDAAFNLFIRNSARFFEGIEPVADTSKAHIRIIEALMPHVSASEGDFAEYAAKTDLTELAAHLEMDLEKLKILMESFESLGFVKLNPAGKILTAGRSELAGLIKKYYREKVFCGADPSSGAGLSALISIISKKERAGITI